MKLLRLPEKTILFFYKSFINNVLPLLVDQNLGVIAMKTLSNGGFFGGTTHFSHGDEQKIIPKFASIQEALHFVWSLPVGYVPKGVTTPVVDIRFKFISPAIVFLKRPVA